MPQSVGSGIENGARTTSPFGSASPFGAPTAVFPGTDTSNRPTGGFGTLIVSSKLQSQPVCGPLPGAWPGSQLFSHTASRTRFFNSNSASIFFSSLFSRSSSFIRLASFTSISPNCFRHRWYVASEIFFSWLTSRSASRCPLHAASGSSPRSCVAFPPWSGSFFVAQTVTPTGSSMARFG